MEKIVKDEHIKTKDPLKTCPFFHGKNYFTVQKKTSIISLINYWGMRILRKFWLPSYFGYIYADIPHFYPNSMLDRLFWGHKRIFHQATIIEGKSASEFFTDCGMYDFAKKNGGICSFRMGITHAIYQNTNLPLIEDEYLSPPTTQNKNLFGDFMGTLNVNSRDRKRKRAIVESILGNSSFMKEIKEELLASIKQLLNIYNNRALTLEDFCRELVADIDSKASGILDLKEKSLSYYFKTNKYRDISANFFEIASEVISKLNSKSANKKLNDISDFVRRVLLDNFQSISSSPDTNLIKRYFNLWRKPFTKASIKNLSDSNLKELGTIIVAIYDTTSLSLSWAISYIEKDISIKNRIIKCSKLKNNHDNISYIDLVVFEAVRLGGSNPTALWRKIVKSLTIDVGRRKIFALSGTMLWLDRRNANMDHNIFPDPKKLNPKNIESIITGKSETISSIMSHKRYEINSFSMINAKNNPRKCPGRLFSVFLQSLIIGELYKSYKVFLIDNSIDLKRFSAMPKQSSSGFITIKKRNL